MAKKIRRCSEAHGKIKLTTSMTTIENLNEQWPNLMQAGFTGVAEVMKQAAAELEALQEKCAELQAVVNHLHENCRLKIEAYQERDSLRSTVAELQHDIEAYRGALGYPVHESHDGKLTNGETPQCGLCNSKHRKKMEHDYYELQKDKMRLDWGEKNFARVALGTPQLVGEKWTIFGPSDDGSDDVEGNTLREAIDAAMSGEEK